MRGYLNNYELSIILRPELLFELTQKINYGKESSKKGWKAG